MSLPQQTGDATGTHGIKGEHIVDASEPVASSNQGEKNKTSMMTLIREMALLCSVPDVYIRNLIKEHDLAVGEDVSGNVNLVLSALHTTYERSKG